MFWNIYYTKNSVRNLKLLKNILNANINLTGYKLSFWFLFLHKTSNTRICCCSLLNYNNKTTTKISSKWLLNSLFFLLNKITETSYCLFPSRLLFFYFLLFRFQQEVWLKICHYSLAEFSLVYTISFLYKNIFIVI